MRRRMTAAISTLALLALALPALAGAPKKRIVLDPAVAADDGAVKKLESHLYEMPPVDLAKVARAMLEEHGFSIPEQSDPLNFSSEWKPQGKSGRIRYSIHVVAMSVAASQIEFVREEDAGDGDVKKSDDLDAEWAILERHDPAAADAIKADAAK